MFLAASQHNSHWLSSFSDFKILVQFIKIIEKGQLVHTKNPLAYFVNAKLGLGSGM